MSEDTTSSETSPTTRKWNKLEQELNDTQAETKEEQRRKLHQKIMLKRTRRLSRYAQNLKLENIKQKMLEKEEEEKKQKELELAKQEKKREQNRKKRLKRKNKNKLENKSETDLSTIECHNHCCSNH